MSLPQFIKALSAEQTASVEPRSPDRTSISAALDTLLGGAERPLTPPREKQCCLVAQTGVLARLLLGLTAGPEGKLDRLAGADLEACGQLDSL